MSKEDYRQFLEGLKKEYEEDGYKVVIEPSKNPEFLKNFRPDLIASKEGDNVVVEIKELDDKAVRKGLAELATLVNSQPGWRLDIVLYKPAGTRAFQLSTPKSVRKALGDAEKLFEEGQKSAALMLAWSALEAAARRTLVKNIDEDLGDLTSLDLIKNLVFHGFISEADYKHMVDLSEVRNGLAHGALRLSVGARDFHRLVKLGSELIEARHSEAA